MRTQSKNHIRRPVILLVLTGLAMSWGAVGAFAEEPGNGAATEARSDSAAITQRIAELDDDEFAVRAQAREALLEIGAAAIPGLLHATKSESPEQRLSAKAIVEEIRRRALTSQFKALAERPGDDLDVEQGMLLIAKILDPDLVEEMISAELDQIAEAVRKALGPGVKPAAVAPMEFMIALTKVLKESYGLTGDEETYHHPDNSSLLRVLTRKKGLPILLSEIAVAVGRRLEVPLVGLSIPGRYMFKYDGARAPAGAAQDDIIIDPFGGWTRVTPEVLARGIPGFDPRTDLEPCPGRFTLVRMLNNMQSDALAQRNPRLAEAIEGYRALLVPVP